MICKDSLRETQRAPGQPVDAAGPVFAEPWEASAFALAVDLSRSGHFTWPEWVAALSREIAADAEGHGPADDGSGYYRLWLAALETLLTAKGLIDAAALEGRARYLEEHPVPHTHAARRGPIAVA